MRAEYPACRHAGNAVFHPDARTLSMAPWRCPYVFAVLLSVVKTAEPP